MSNETELVETRRLLVDLAQQVRGFTLQLLTAVPDGWLLWSPAGTSNHILWHGGHGLWLQGVLCLKKLVGASELPDGWDKVFGQHCQPVHLTQEWPERKRVVQLLEQQLERMVDVIETAPAAALTQDESIVSGIIHGLHDEARHHGEMYLLLKICKAFHNVVDV